MLIANACFVLIVNAGQQSYTQTVLDVLCAYLRRPFIHPSFTERPDNPDQAEVEPDANWSAERLTEADQEQQVRLTAQRLITALLPNSSTADPVLYDLDLTAANLEYLDLAGRQVGHLIARRARLHGINRLSNVWVHHSALFSGATFHGATYLLSARFDGGLALLRARFGGTWHVAGAEVRTFIDLRTAAPEEQVGALTILGHVEVKVDEDNNWAVQSKESTNENSPRTAEPRADSSDSRDPER